MPRFLIWPLMKVLKNIFCAMQRHKFLRKIKATFKTPLLQTVNLGSALSSENLHVKTATHSTEFGEVRG